MTNVARQLVFSQTDKVSLLGSTIEYVHHLRERVKALREHQSTQSTAESPMMFDARCCIGSDDQEDDEAASPSWVSPRVEANVRGTTVLLRIVCPEKKGVLIMVLTELEKHGLSVINTSVVPFADSSLNITISAEVNFISTVAIFFFSTSQSIITVHYLFMYDLCKIV